jgi:hypothetical protein
MLNTLTAICYPHPFSFTHGYTPLQVTFLAEQAEQLKRDLLVDSPVFVR